jgi:hypothetical protein
LICSTNTDVLWLRTVTLGRYVCSRALRDVGATSTVDDGRRCEDWSTTQ